MKYLNALFLLSFLTLSSTVQAQCAPWLDHEIKQLHSKNQIDLCTASSDSTLLIVNTASHCGFTPQFRELEALHKKYRDKGLVVIGFPSNSFYQESRSEEETAEVCYVNFGVSFLMTEHVAVKGSDSHEIFKTIASEVGAPNWNFNKVLVSRDGRVLKRFPSSVSPSGNELTSAIEAELNNKS